MTYNSIINEIKLEFPKFKVVCKSDSWMMKVIDIFLKIVSFGQANKFMTVFVTTIGNTIYVPNSWDTLDDVFKISVLRHERVHMRQSKKYWFPFYSFLYLFVFFPVVFAWYRKKFEQEAYEESLRAMVDLQGKEILDKIDPEFFISQFTTGAYLWTWPFRKSITKWYNETKAKILTEQETKP